MFNKKDFKKDFHLWICPACAFFNIAAVDSFMTLRHNNRSDTQHLFDSGSDRKRWCERHL